MASQNRDPGTALFPTAKDGSRENAVKAGNLNKTIHDFRSSLNVIMGYSELMLDGALGNMTQEQREGMRDILTSSQQMLDMINDVSAWQKAGPGLR